MKKTLIFGSAVAMVLPLMLASCGPKTDNSGTKPTPDAGGTITVWVGNESVDFYKKVSAEYTEAHPEFGYKVSIVGADTGAAAGAMTTDNTACADIITIAHDNIGKLSQKSLIKPIVEQDLLDQIEADNPDAFKRVIKNKLGAGKDAQEFTFGVPYISQALFLYYNKKFVTAEQAKTFEGLEEAAKAVGKKAYTVTGTDSFNMSFTTLAVRERDKYTSVKIYDDFKMKNSFFQGNDTVAVTRWAQESFANPNGGMFPSSSGYVIDMAGNNDNKTPEVLSVIGGAWHFEAIKKTLGEENIGCALIPTFTLKENHVAGLTANEFDSNVPVAGDVYRGGTFADCKVLAINMARDPKKDTALAQLVKFFSSKEIQNRSFLEAGNVPAYAGAKDYIESIKSQIPASQYEMAVSQTGMAEYGIAQPFMTGILNTYFYSKGVDAIYKAALVNDKNAYGNERAIRELLYSIEHTWTKGKAPLKADIPATLPAAMPSK